MFTQILDPTGNLFVTWLVALIPVVLLLFLLAGLRMSAWLAVLIGSIVTFLLGLWVWQMPLGDGIRAYLYGSATGIWNVDWITFWGVMLFNTLVDDRRLRQVAALADPAGNPRRARADHPVRLGVRRAARGSGRLRLSVGLRRADPDHARHSGS